MLSNRVDIVSHVDGNTSFKIQMAEYFTETNGCPEKKEEIFHAFYFISYKYVK